MSVKTREEKKVDEVLRFWGVDAELTSLEYLLLHLGLGSRSVLIKPHNRDDLFSLVAKLKIPDVYIKDGALHVETPHEVLHPRYL